VVSGAEDGGRVRTIKAPLNELFSKVVRRAAEKGPSRERGMVSWLRTVME